MSLNPLFQDSIEFEPHITITSQLAVNSMSDVNTVLSSCAAALKGGGLELTIILSSLFINSKNSYFKKIYLDVDKSKNLTSLATIIRELFVILPATKDEENARKLAQEWGNSEFKPHLSLIYTNSNHFDSALIKTITTRVEDYLNIDGIRINELNDFNEFEIGWKNGVLKIVECEGPVNEWKVLGSIEIH